MDGGDGICRDDFALQKLRNCGGKFEKVRLVWNGQLFFQCPISWLRTHPMERAYWECYADCCGGQIGEGIRFLPNAGNMNDQPNLLLEGLFVICDQVQRLLLQEKKSQQQG